MTASYRFRVWGCALMCCVVLSGRAAGQEVPRGEDGTATPTPLHPPFVRGEAGAAGVSPSQLEDAVPVPLDPHIVFQRVIVGADGVARSMAAHEGGVAGAGERIIYSNTLGVHAVNFPSNQPVSDDIATTVPNGCALTRYRFKVLGKVLPAGVGGEYTVNYGLYTNCPLAVGSNSAIRDLVKIAGTEGTLDFPDDGPRLIEHVVPAGTPVALPTNVYLGLRFNRGNCGTVVGAPAMVGYSGDIWDFPGFPCNGFLGGFPELPHASFWVEMFGSEVCAESFVGYKAQRPSGGTATLGANVQGADDFKVIVEDCQMIGYEVAVRGVGFYTFELRRSCTGEAIAGTERNFIINTGATPLLQVARFSFDPAIPLGNDGLFLAFEVSSNSAGAVVTGIEPIIGQSGGDYFVATDGGCSPVTPTQGVHGAINLAITCAGTLPLGACCDPYLTECAGGADAGKRCLANSDCAAPGTCEAVCRQTTELNCPFPPLGQELRPQWQVGEACEPDPFGHHPCGVAACCHFRENPFNPQAPLEHVCVNLTKNECQAQLQEPVAPEWQVGEYCGINAQQCTRYHCPNSDIWCKWGYCPFPYSCIPNDPDCCFAICASGPQGAFCCNTAWDALCCELVEQFCPNTPPNDQCAPGHPNPDLSGAKLISVPGSWGASNIDATTDESEPGFYCHNGTGVCIGGNNAGAMCVVGQDCASGDCSERVPNPGGQGSGTIWFKFVQPVGQTSVGISTCTSNAPALDSIVQVFAATDHSSPLAECNSLVPIACNDDFDGCASTQRNSRLCVHDLTPGETYYIMLAAKTENRRGHYIVTISTSDDTTERCTPCPVGNVEYVDPPNGVVDARIPHKPNGPHAPHGIRSFTVSGPTAAPARCWSFCESDTASTVRITNVIEEPSGMYRIELDKPITTESTAFLSYTDDNGHTVTGRFIAHPANANGDSYSNAGDILALVDHLNGVKVLPWGLYSGDINRSGAISPADIVTLIDLLNGANGFAVWNGTARPDAEGCP